MAYMQRMRLTKVSDLDDAATWRYKLPSVGKYTALELRISADRHAAHLDADTCYPLEADITKIEVLKGGAEVVKSLTGTQLDAMNYWDFKRPNPRRHRQGAGMDNQLCLFLLGGRDLYDREYGFDMAKLGETYLEYTYNLKEGTAEHFKADKHVVEIFGWRWMGPGEPNFKGYFRDRQLAAWTTTAVAALKTIQIPVGKKIRRVGVQCKTRATTLGGAFTELELQVNKGEWSPMIVKSPMQWVMAEVQEYDLHNSLSGLEQLVSGEVTDLPYWFSYYDDVDCNNYATVAGTVLTWGLITLPPRAHAYAGFAGELRFQESGYGFQKCLRLGFDHEWDGFDLLDTAGMGALDLICTEAAASIAAAAFVQDIVPY